MTAAAVGQAGLPELSILPLCQCHFLGLHLKFHSVIKLPHVQCRLKLQKQVFS